MNSNIIRIILFWCLISSFNGIGTIKFVKAEDTTSIKELIIKIKEAKEQKEISKIKDILTIKIPKTEEDIDILVKELEGTMSPIAQKVLQNTNDKNLVPALIRSCENKSIGLKNLKEEDFREMSKDKRKEEVNRRVGLEVLIETLGKLKDRQSIPTLRKFLDYEGLTYPASTALSRLGDDEINKELMDRMEQQKGINLTGIKAGNLKKIMEEIDNPNVSINKKGKLIGQIKGSRDPEVNTILKELALRHKDTDVRGQAGLALVNSIIADKNVGDPEFLIQWASMETKDQEEDWSRGWVVNAMDITWDPRYIPVLINLLRKSLSFSTRSDAAGILGKHKVTEAVPYLEEAMRNDSEIGVRGSAWAALKSITGKTYLFIHPRDVKDRINYLGKFPQERGIGEIYTEEKEK